MAVTIRNTISNERYEVPADASQTVREAIENSGFVYGDFSARDKDGNVVDGEPVSRFDGRIIDVGLPGTSVTGG